jgi:hypothetical protein
MNLKVVLTLSLAANIALGFVAWRKNSEAPAPVSSESLSPPTESKAESSTKVTPMTIAAPPAAATSTNTPSKRFDWQSVESADYKEYIANLRAIGCPEETIRDIITADVNKMFDDKKRQARGPSKKYEFWKTGSPMMGMPSAEELKLSRQIDEERNATLKNLGIQPDLRSQVSSMMNPLESMFDFVSEDKRAELLKAMTSMQESFASGGQPDAQDFLKAQQDMEKKVKALLTPEEALQYDLRMSMTANMMRQQLNGFEPSEAEFLKVFDLRKKFDDEFSPLGIMNEKEDGRKKRTEAQQALNDQLKTTLGESRYIDYERAQDPYFQQMFKAAQRGEVGGAQAIQAWEMKKMAEEKANELRRRGYSNQAERDAALRAIRAETESSLRQTLGEKGWENYNRPMNTIWLDQIARTAPTAVKP